MLEPTHVTRYSHPKASRAIQPGTRRLRRRILTDIIDDPNIAARHSPIDSPGPRPGPESLMLNAVTKKTSGRCGLRNDVAAAPAEIAPRLKLPASTDPNSNAPKRYGVFASPRRFGPVAAGSCRNGAIWPHDR